MLINSLIKNLLGQGKYLYSTVGYARKLGVKVGDSCFIADRHHWSSEPFLITIGSYCQITERVKFFTHGGGQVLRDKIPDFDAFGKIQIGDWVYIGSGSMIMPGVTVGNNVLIAAGSVVTKSVPPRVVVAGNPAKIICTIDEFYEKNKKYNIKTKGKTNSEKKELLLSLPDDRFVVKPYMKLPEKK